MTSHRPVRYFGTWMGFTAEAPGLWFGEFRGERFELEKRRGEPGAPGGWYYYGPGHRTGVLCGDKPEDAAETAIECAGKFTECVRTGDRTVCTTCGQAHS